MLLNMLRWPEDMLTFNCQHSMLAGVRLPKVGAAMAAKR